MAVASMDHRGIDVVLKDMRQHPQDAKVQEKGCKALMSLARKADNSVKIGAGGGVEAIVQAMGGHRGSEGVQRKGCVALLSLGQSNRDILQWSLGRSNRDILQRIKSAGAEEAVQRAIASPGALESTKEYGQKLLSLLRSV